MKEEFLKQLMVAVKAKFGEMYEVLLKEALKNGDKWTEVLIKGCKDVVALTIYIDSILQQVEVGGLTMQEGVDKVFEVPLESFVDMTVLEIMRNLTKQDILDRVMHSVVNGENKKEYLFDKPYRKFLDLAVIYRVILKDSEGSCVSIVLTNNICSRYGIDLIELEKAAKRNTERRGFFVERLREVLAKITKSSLYECGPEELWVCGLKGITDMASYGACVLLYESVFKELSNKLGTNLFIFPSSVHEVLVLSAEFASDGFQELVKEINRSEVIEADDILSDSVYFYNKETNRVTIAGEAD